MAEGGREAMIARFRALPEAIRGTYPQMAEAMLDEIRSNIRAQVSPGGVPWPASPTGKPVLLMAQDALRYSVTGSTIVLSINGDCVRHHFGGVRGGRMRQILPRSVASLERARKRIDYLARRAVKEALRGAK